MRKPRRGAPTIKPGRFLREVWIELNKVLWPSRAEVITHSSVVVGFILFMGGVVWVFDLLFNTLADWLNLFGA